MIDRHLRLPAIALWAGLVLAPVAARADTWSLRGYFESLPDPVPAQSASALWSFHQGTGDGAYLPVAASGDRYRLATDVQQIGALTEIGQNGCSAGFCPAVPAQSRSTFQGVFVHSGASTATAAVFHVPFDMTLDAIRLWSETVGNANNGNGFEVTVRTRSGGATQTLGSFDFTYGSTAASKDEHVYAPGSLLQAGDRIEILYGNNGSYLYDHGNAQVFIDGTRAAIAPPVTAPIPEPGTYALMLAGLAAVGAVVRRRRPGAA